MAELLPIWGNSQLTGGTPPPAFNFPNTNNAKTIKINNQSRYWLILSQTQTGIDIDRIEPFSFLIMPYQPDMSIRVDPEDTPVSSLAADMEFVDYSTMSNVVAYSKGSTWFMGTQSTTIEGDVNLGSQGYIDVQIQGTPTMALTTGTQVGITGTPNVSITGTPTVALQSGSKVGITGTVTTVTYSASIQDASGSIQAASTSQTVVGSAQTRAYLFFQNISTADMWLDFGGALMSVGHGIYVPPNGSLVYENSFVPNDQLNVISATQGAAYTCKYA